jgi:signal transduction histidine kinase
VPPGMDPRSTVRVVPARRRSGTLGRTVVSPQAAHPASTLTRKQLLSDAAIAVAVFAASLGLLAAGDSDLWDRAGFEALAVLLTALASLPLLARRRAPLSVFVVTALGSTALRAIAAPAGPPIGPTVALYGLVASSEGSRARTRLILALVVMLLAAHATASGLADDRFPGAELLFGVLVWGGTWLAGDRARLRAERMAELEDRALRAEREAERERRLAAAEERMRIARDLHDSAGHAINVILVHAGAGRLRAERDPAAACEAFETIEEVARETVGEIDQLVGVLRDDGSSPEGPGVEPPPGVAALEALVKRHRAAGLKVTTTVWGDSRALPPSVDRGAYRILQEALTNAARHGDGSAQVEVTIGRTTLEVTVANPLGQGGPVRGDGGGRGVIGMRERAALLGGSLEAGARDGRFEVRGRLPFVGHPA